MLKYAPISTTNNFVLKNLKNDSVFLKNILDFVPQDSWLFHFHLL